MIHTKRTVIYKNKKDFKTKKLHDKKKYDKKV